MDVKDVIYLDYAATTPVDPQVLAVMLPYFTDTFGNPSSIHTHGQMAEAALDMARQSVASHLNAREEEIIFTSCGTESDNLALRGCALSRRKKFGADHLLISPVEHHAVSHTAQQLAEEYGFQLDLLPVDEYGQVDPGDVESALRSDTAVVSIVYANNEIGTINPISEIGKVCRERGVPFHTDAVQAAAHLPMNVVTDQIDMLSMGAHKFYGPKGVGVLFVRQGLDILPTQTGGSQETGFRAGTQNVPYIVGLSEAFRLAQMDTHLRSQRYNELRDPLIHTVLDRIPRSKLTGHPSQRLPNHASFIFEGVDGNALLMALDIAGFACSSGSACRVGTPKPSEILEAIGVSHNWALGSLRVTLGSGTTSEHIDRFCDILPNIIERLRR